MIKRKSATLKKLLIILIVTVALIVFFVIKNPQSLQTTISKDEAITKVKTLPEVKDYLKRVPNGLVLVNGEENNAYMIQVYEFKNGLTATFNWYSVDKNTGGVKKEF